MAVPVPSVTAVTVPGVFAPGLFPNARVTTAPEIGALTEFDSWTFTAGVICAPAAVSVGCTVKVSIAPTGGAIVRGKMEFVDCCGEPESWTLTVKVKDPRAAGFAIEEIWPLEELRIRPVGRVPCETVQVREPAPPVAVSWAE